MIARNDAIAVVGAATAAEVGSFLVLDSALASLAAFGSVLGLGVLHFRSRRAKLQPAPPAEPEPPSTELTSMRSPPAPQPPRRDETFIAVAELCTRIDSLQRTLDADDGLAQRLDAIRQSLAEVSASADLRAARASEEGAFRAGTLADACKAVEQRVAAAEARLLENAKRLERSLSDNAERAADRGKEALTKLVRELASLRDDVQRATASVGEIQSAQKMPVTLHDDHARVLAGAAEQAASLARRVAAMSERLDAGLQRLEETGSAASSRAHEELRDARTRLESLARDAATLHASSAELRSALAQTEARVVKAVRESETRLEATLQALRELVAALPAPERMPDVQPILAAIERLSDDLRALATTPPPAPTDLSPTLDAVADARATIEKRLAAMEATLRPRAVELTPIVDAVARAHEGVQHRLNALESALRPRAVELTPIVEAVRDAKDEVVAAVANARAEPVDLAPTIDAIARAHESVQSRLHAMESALRPRPVELAPIVDAVRDAKGEIIAAVAHARSDPVDLAPTLGAVARAHESVQARLGAMESRLREAIAHAGPEEIDLRPLLDAIHDARAAPTDLSPLVRAVAAAEERLAKRFHETQQELATAFHEARAPAPDLAPVVGAVVSAEERLAKRLSLAESALRPRDVDLSPILDALRDTQQEMAAALRDARAPAVDLAPVVSAVASAEERLAKRLSLAESALRPRDVDLAPVLAALREAKGEIAALGERIPEATDLAPVQANMSRLHEQLVLRLDRLAEALLKIPVPEPVEVDLAPLHDEIRRIPLDEVASAVRSSEMRLADALRRLREDVGAQAAHAPTVDLTPIASALRDAEERLARRMGASTEAERVARREETLKLEASLAALRDALAAMPSPAPFPTDAILGAICDVEERIERRLAAATEAERASRREDSLRLDAGFATLHDALDAMPQPQFPLEDIHRALRDVEARMRAAVREAVSSIPRPEAPTPFPLDEIEASLRELEARLAGRVGSVREAVAAIPAPPAPPAFPIQEIQVALREAESRLASRVAGVREAVAAIPAPPEPPAFPLEAIASSMRELEARLAGRVNAVRDAVEAIPAPPEPPAFPVEAITGTVRAAEERIARVVAQLDAARPISELAARFDRVATHADVQAARTSFAEASEKMADHTREILDAHLGTHERLDAAARWMRDESERQQRALHAVEERLALAPYDAAKPLATSDALRHMHEATLAAIAAMRHEMSRAAEEQSLSLHDAVEDLRAEVDARHRRVEAVLAASEATMRALQARLSEREHELERRVTARIASLEERLLDELRSMGGRMPVELPEMPPVPHPRPRRAHRPASE